MCMNNRKVFNDTLLVSSPPLTVDDMISTIREIIKIYVIRLYIPLYFFKRFSVIDKLTFSNIYNNDDTLNKLNIKVRDFKAGLTDMFKYKT